jgi:hypothetical protein
LLQLLQLDYYEQNMKSSLVLVLIYLFWRYWFSICLVIFTYTYSGPGLLVSCIESKMKDNNV